MFHAIFLACFSLLLLAPLSQAAVPFSESPNVPSYLEFQKYNTPAGFNEHNLWWIEENRVRRSEPLVSPDFEGYVFAEVMFIPDSRQTQSTLYWVPLPRLPLGPTSLDATSSQQPHAHPNLNDPRSYTSWFDPVEMMKRRQAILKVNQGQQKGFSFETLTPVDWNMQGDKLLLKRRAGILYTGERATDVLIWDRTAGTMSIYQELLRALEYQWEKRLSAQDAPPRLNAMAWDIEPLGWKTGAENILYWRAWAYTNHPEKKRFPLGLWAYHLDNKQTLFVDPDSNMIPNDVAQHGFKPVIHEAKYPTDYWKKIDGNKARRMGPPRQQQRFF